MKPTLAQVSTLTASFDVDVLEYAAGQCHAIEVWLGKLEAYLETHTVADVLALLNRHQMLMPVAAFQGGILQSQGDSRQEHWNHFVRRLELCKSLGINTLVVAADIRRPLTTEDLPRIHLSLHEAAKQAGEHQLRLALEFQADAVFCNNLQTAIALVDEIDHESLGLCLDVFHYGTGPSKPDDLDRLTTDNLYHVQLSDLAGCARELATDADRVLPGDGDFCLKPLIDQLRKIDYTGSVSIELMNPKIWQVTPRTFGEIGMTVLKKILGRDSLGENPSVELEMPGN